MRNNGNKHGERKRRGVTASQDMTFCNNKKCKETKCDRHHSHIDWSIAPPWRSFAEFEGTKYCRKGGKGGKVY